jgi:hypothetical protein
VWATLEALTRYPETKRALTISGLIRTTVKFVSDQWMIAHGFTDH